MYYIFQNGDDFGFKCDGIHEITKEDVAISDEIYYEFFNSQCGNSECCGKSLRLKNIYGTTIEEMFEEYVPAVEPQAPSEIELLKARVEELEKIVASLTGTGEDFVVGDALRIVELSDVTKTP